VLYGIVFRLATLASTLSEVYLSGQDNGLGRLGGQAHLVPRHSQDVHCPQLFGDPVSELAPVLRYILAAPHQPDIVVDTHCTGNLFGLKANDKEEAARLMANAQFKSRKGSEGPFPLIWGFEAQEEGSITLMEGETSFVILGTPECLADHKAHLIDIRKHTGQREPYEYLPAFWYDGSQPGGPVQVDIQILSDPPLVTPFQRSYAIRFDQQGGGVVVE